MADYLVTDTELTSIANAIRTKGGTSSALLFPTGFVNAIGSIPTGGGGTLIAGILRPDATLVQRFAYDKLLVQDEGISIGTYAYTTNIKNYVSKALLTTLTFDTSYFYYIIQYGLTYPIYDQQATKGTGFVEYNLYHQCLEPIIIPAGTYKSGNMSVGTATVDQTLKNFTSTIYWDTNNSISRYSSACGPYTGFQTINISSSNLTADIYSPNLSIKGSATYFTQTAWDAMTDIRYQYIIDIYRVPNTADVKGWSNTSIDFYLADVADSNSKTLLPLTSNP